MFLSLSRFPPAPFGQCRCSWFERIDPAPALRNRLSEKRRVPSFRRLFRCGKQEPAPARSFQNIAGDVIHPPVGQHLRCDRIVHCPAVDLDAMGVHQFQTLLGQRRVANIPVSYTHLDVYKRQEYSTLSKLDSSGQSICQQNHSAASVMGPIRSVTQV